MDQNFLKSLLDNGVAIAILAFFLWFILKPLINAYIRTLSDQSESMKELSESMREMVERLPDVHRIERKIDETRENIKKHIDSKFAK